MIGRVSSHVEARDVAAQLSVEIDGDLVRLRGSEVPARVRERRVVLGAADDLGSCAR
jgi:hypothetical protein